MWLAPQVLCHLSLLWFGSVFDLLLDVCISVTRITDGYLLLIIYFNFMNHIFGTWRTFSIACHD